MAYLGLGLGLGYLPVLTIQFFLLACPFVSRVTAFIYDVRVRRVVSMFNDDDDELMLNVLRCHLTY